MCYFSFVRACNLNKVNTYTDSAISAVSSGKHCRHIKSFGQTDGILKLSGYTTSDFLNSNFPFSDDEPTYQNKGYYFIINILEMYFQRRTVEY